MPRPLRSQRRTPRVPLRVWATLEHRGAEWRVETEDVGPGGCLVRSERLLVPGLDLRIVLQKSAVSEELAADGKVAWYDAPRGGIAFDPRQSRASNAWFRRLLAADRRLAQAVARSPAELELDTRLFLPTPPRIVDLHPDEAVIVGCAEQGIPVRELVARSGLSDQRLGQVVSGLLEKRVFTLAAGEAGEAWKWRAALAARTTNRTATAPPTPTHPQAPRAPAPTANRRPIPVLTAIPKPNPAAAPAAQIRPPASPPPAPSAHSLAIASGAAASPSLTSGAPPPRPPIARPPTLTPVPAPTLTLTPAPALASALAPATPPPAARSRYEPSTGTAVMARILRGVGSNQRPLGAETELGHARVAEAAGRVAEAIRFTRRALAMAPQDREIAGQLARLAFIHPVS